MKRNGIDMYSKCCRAVNTDQKTTAQNTKFFALCVKDPKALHDYLEHVISVLPPMNSFRLFWTTLRDQDLLKREFHITLLHASVMHLQPLICKELSTLEGKRVDIALTALYQDERVIAATVEAQDGIPHYSKQRLHITIGTISKVNPKEANDMLRQSSKRIDKLSIRIELECRYRAY